VQPVTHMSSTNSKPQLNNQFPTDKIKSRPKCFLIRETVSLGYTSQNDSKRKNYEDLTIFWIICK